MSTPGMQDPNQSNFQALTLRDLLGVLKRRQWLIYINIILFLAVGAIYTAAFQDPAWEGGSAVLVKPDPRTPGMSSPDTVVPEIIANQTYDVRTFSDLVTGRVLGDTLEVAANHIAGGEPFSEAVIQGEDPTAAAIRVQVANSLTDEQQAKLERLWEEFQVQNLPNEEGDRARGYLAENAPQIRALPPAEGSQLLRFNIVSNDPLLMNVYKLSIYYSLLDFATADRGPAVDRAQTFLTNAITDIEDELADLRQEERDLKNEAEISNFSTELSLRQQRVAEAESLLAQAENNFQTSLEAQRQAERVLRDILVQSPTRETVEVQNNLGQVLQAENDLEQLQLQKEALLVRFFPDAQPVQTIDAQIEAKQQQIDNMRENLQTVRTVENPLIQVYEQRVEEASIAAAAARERLAQASRQLAEAEGELLALNDQQPEFENIGNQRLALQQSLQQQEAILDRLELRENNVRTPLELLWSTDSEQVRPNWRSNLTAAGFLGLLVGLVVAFSKESLDSTYHNPIELARHVQRDILARVPKRPSSERALITNPSEAASFESYRLLASNLIARLARQGVEKPVTVVSSAEPNVGKTTVAANLATAVALRGNKTVLVDAAFRNPSLHEVFDLENGEGLVNALKDSAADPTKLVQATSNEQLSVLTTGSGIEESSIDLLETNRMGEIVQALFNDFDYVLVDVSRAVPFADAANVARYSNSGLIVFDEKKQDPHLISEAIGALEMQGAPVVGLVVNKAKKAKDLLAQK